MFNYVLGKPIRNDKEIFDPVKITGKVIEDLKCSIKDQNINVTCIFGEMEIFETNSYVAKTILELILCEEIRKCTDEISIHTRGNVLTIKKTNSNNTPEMYLTFLLNF